MACSLKDPSIGRSLTCFFKKRSGLPIKISFGEGSFQIGYKHTTIRLLSICSQILIIIYMNLFATRSMMSMGLLSTPAFGFATKNLKQIKIRMKAVLSIKKITKAMKMVAASKMKQDVTRLERSKGFGLGSLQKVFTNEPYLQKKKVASNPKKTLLVPFTTDKGLCGGTNSNIIREVKAMVKQDRNAYKVYVVGDKGSLALTRPMPDLIEYTITHMITPMNFPTASAIAYQILNAGTDCDRIVLVYNEFKNVISQVQRKMELLTKKDFLKQFKFVVKHDTSEPQTEFSAHYFYDFYVCTAFYGAILNNVASEQSARMNAMENASKNAGEILDKLTLEYNKARQAKITMELCEIISGASAV